MRWSIHNRGPVLNPAPMGEVRLHGQPVPKVRAFDTEEGWVTFLPADKFGAPLINRDPNNPDNDHIYEVTLYGRVTVEKGVEWDG